MKTTRTKMGCTYQVYQIIDEKNEVVGEFVNKQDAARYFDVSDRMGCKYINKGSFNHLGKHYRVNIIKYPILLVDDDELKVYDSIKQVSHEYLNGHNAKIYDHLNTGTTTFVGHGTDLITIKQFGKEYNWFHKEASYSKNEVARLKNSGTVSLGVNNGHRKPKRLPGQPDRASEEDRKKQRELLHEIEKIPNLLDMDKDCELFMKFRSLLSYEEDDDEELVEV